nr:MAG TPA: protein of unknown function DUF296 [Caudoviricetes sp.]
MATKRKRTIILRFAPGQSVKEVLDAYIEKQRKRYEKANRN